MGPIQMSVKSSTLIYSLPLQHWYQIMSPNDLEQLEVEIESMKAWYSELATYLQASLQDPTITAEEFAVGATQATRVLVRLKASHDQLNAHRAA